MTPADRLRVGVLRLQYWLTRPWLRPGSAVYDRWNAHEIAEFEGQYTAAGFEDVPPVWNRILDRATARIAAATGMDPHAHVIERLRAKPGARLLSLGSGAGGLEIHYALAAPSSRVTGLELSPSAVEQANAAARERGANARFEVADLNTAALPAGFDIVFAHASLHHILKLEHLVAQMERALQPGGVLIVHDTVTRNGHRLWPETRRLTDAVWRTLPARLRVNHCSYAKPRLDAALWEVDTRLYGMECIRSEDIVPLLDRHFQREVHYPYMAFVRRMLDPIYGPNYDLENPLDRAIVDWLWELDCAHVESGRLRGESLFAVYRRR